MELIPLWAKDENNNTILRDFTIVSNEDFEELNKDRWSLLPKGYVATGGSKELMHRRILGCVPGDGLHIDHINGNKLDNQRLNLRFVSRSQNESNKPSRKGTSSEYKGVSFDKARGKWMANIKLGNKIYRLGRFSTEIEAAIVYDNKAKELQGEFARLNIMDEDAKLALQIQAEEFAEEYAKALQKAILRVQTELDNATLAAETAIKQAGINKNSVTGVTSNFKGVCFEKESGKWMAHLTYNAKTYNLGRYVYEDDADLAYRTKVLEIYGEFAQPYTEKEPSSKYRGVTWDKKNEKWQVQLKFKTKHYALGRYGNEIEAALAYNIKGIELGIDPIKLNVIPDIDEVRIQIQNDVQAREEAKVLAQVIKAQARTQVEAQVEVNINSEVGETSIYRGVNWNKRSGKWIARLMVNGKSSCLGSFTTEVEAALAYNERVMELGLVSAKLNVISELLPV